MLPKGGIKPTQMVNFFFGIGLWINLVKSNIFVRETNLLIPGVKKGVGGGIFKFDLTN